MDAFNILIGVLMAATVLVLALGLVSMLRGGEGEAKRSNKLMMMRVGFQAAVIALLGFMFMLRT